MKKSTKLTLTIMITIALYISYFFLFKITPSTERSMFTLTFSAIGTIIAIILGIIITLFTQKKNIQHKASTKIIEIVIVLTYMIFFGPLSLLGFLIGQFIVEKPKK